MPASPLRSSSLEVEREEKVKSCLNCSQKAIAYQPVGCRHPSLCKGCAMKQATGGKCKVCGEKFFELQKI